MHTMLLLLFLLPAALPASPCVELRFPCRCHLVAVDEIAMDCDSVVFGAEFPAFPYRAPIVSFRQRWAGHQALPMQAFTASALPLRSLDFSSNSLRRLTDRLLNGLQGTLEELLLADNLLGDNLNPIFSSSEFHGLTHLRLLDLSGNLIKGIEQGILKGCDNLQELKLDRNSLTAVPSLSINGPRALKVLTLTHNHIGAVHTGAFVAQKSLEKIDLSHNSIVTLEGGSLSGLGRLRQLRLAHNKFFRFNSDVFQGTDQLEKLDLSENFISEIPSVALKVFRNLKHLNLSSNLIQSLESANLASQPELEQLDLSRNNIANISPGTFLGLRQLRHLDLSVNALRTVEDDAFEGLENLESLSLRDNNILLIPASALGRLPRLASLQMDYNRVAALSADILGSVAGRVTSLSLARNIVRELPPASFQQFRQLAALDLRGNLLNSITAATFSGLDRSLRTLCLAQNRLVALPSEPLILDQVQDLDVSRNQLAELPRASFTQVPALTHLNLSHNPQLVTVPAAIFHSIPKLEVLDLSHTGLKLLLPELLSHSSNLRNIYVKGNAIQDIAENTFLNLRNLTTIDLSNNNILNIRPGAFSGLTTIRQVFLNGNRLNAFKGELFRGREGIAGTSLEELELSGNELSYLFPSSFRVHPRLRRLVVSHNKFSFFPAELIASLQFLEHVDLAGNSLKSLEELDFARLPRLRTLLLGRNLIESVSESAFHNSTQLQVLDLADNRLERLGERTFEGLARIELLNLANNRLGELPEAIFERSRLQMLENINLSGNKFEVAPLKTLQRQYFFLSSVDLSRNNLRDIPPEDSIMVNIKRLDLSYNPLSPEAVANVLGEPKTVRELNLAGTGITTVMQLETPFMRRLNLSHNAITELPDTIFERPTLLEVLDLSYNNLSTSPPRVWPKLKSLVHVDISANPIMSIVQGDLDGLESLETLKMHGLEQCTRIEKNAFKPLASLVQLEAYGYPKLGYLDVHGILGNIPALEAVDMEVKDASVNSDQLAPIMHPRLRELSVRGLRVRSLSSGALAGLKGSSVMIGLRNTSLTALPPALFFTMPRSTLITLDVGGSQLSTLSPQLLSALDERRGDLKLLGLASNPILCDCGARALRRWLPGAGMSGIRCSAPESLAGQLLIEIADDELTCDPRQPTTTVAPKVKTTTEPEVIWSVRPSVKDKAANTPEVNGSKGTPATGSSNANNNDDKLIIGIVGGVVAFILLLIIIICVVKLRTTNNQYRGGPLSDPRALGSHAPSMMTSNGCTCVKPPMYPHNYAATLPPKMMSPSSNSGAMRPTYATMGRQPYYQNAPYFIPYISDEKEHR